MSAITNIWTKSPGLQHFVLSTFYAIYRGLVLPILLFRIRRKKQLSVVFLVSDVGTWKTEELYLQMKKNERLSPHIVLLPYAGEDESMLYAEKYLQEKGYPYTPLPSDKKINDILPADIIFYQKPYNDSYLPPARFFHNLKSVFCFANYAFHSLEDRWANDQPLHNIAWQLYFENESAAASTRPLMINKGKNLYVTGLPTTDAYLKNKEEVHDPWKSMTTQKKKIIWAPHFTIDERAYYSNSTFLMYADFMIELAQKYADRVQFAFKPHPLLKQKLVELWGAEKTEAYYKKWSEMDNTQLEQGEYVGLFLHSDAMIHDCSSFTIEYHYTKNPVLYLLRGEHRTDNLNEFARKAYNLHQKARSKEEIEQFLVNILEGKDENKPEREQFYQEYLLPPNGKTACENIIQCLLNP